MFPQIIWGSDSSGEVAGGGDTTSLVDIAQAAGPGTTL